MFVNRAIAGTSLDTVMDQIGDEKADTAIIAFGMNDHISGPSNLVSFRQRLDGVVKRLRGRHVTPVLVGFFQQNQLWIRERQQDSADYNAAIRQVAKENHIPFIDPRTAFGQLAGTRQQYEDFTADFMHHPNIYGQRIYFSLLLPYFLDHDVSADNIPNYVIGAE